MQNPSGSPTHFSAASHNQIDIAQLALVLYFSKSESAGANKTSYVSPFNMLRVSINCLAMTIASQIAEYNRPAFE
jgi:hypothetical protein